MDVHQMYIQTFMAKLSIKETKILQEARLKELNIRLEQFNISDVSITEQGSQLVSLCQELNDTSEW